MDSYVIGIDVGGTNVKIMIMDEGRHPAARRSIPTRRETGYEEISDRIIAAIEDMMAGHHIDREAVRAVAMGLPGTCLLYTSRCV